MAENTIELTVRVNSETGQLEVVSQKLKTLGADADKAGKSASGAGVGFKELGKAIGGLASVAAVTAFFKNAVQGAEEDNQAMRRLKFAVEAAGQSFAQNQTQIEAWSKQIQAATRFTDGQAIDTMGKFVRITGDTVQAQKASQLAMSLSVATGKDLSLTTETLTNLINKNERGVMMARKEFGSFVGGAKDGQQVLDILSAKFGDAAFKEEGFTAATSQLKNNWDEFSDSIGAAVIPALTVLTGWLNKGVNGIRAVGDALGALAALWFTTVQGFSQAILAFLKRDFSSLKTIAKDTWEKISSITLESSEMIRGEFVKTTEAHAVHAEVRIQQSQRVTESEQRDRDKAAEDEAAANERAVAMAEDLDRQLLAINTDTLEKKKLLLDNEIAAERAKIVKTISLAQGRNQALQTLDRIAFTRMKVLQDAEVNVKREMAFKTVENALETLSIINSMQSGHTAAQVTRARVILALEKAIAIARLWAAEAGKGVAGIALASAGTALIVAQFAQQSKAIGDAAKVADTGVDFSGTRTDVDLGHGETYTDGSVAVGGARTSGGVGSGSSGMVGGTGAVGGGVGGGIVNVGGISINLDVASLDLSAVEVVARRIREAVLSGTVEAVKMAVAINIAAQKNSDMAI
jgi:hypothetical protein